MSFSNFSFFSGVVLLSLFICDLSNGISVQKDLTLTPWEKNKLDLFRKNVAHLLYRDHMKHDIYLIRWLRARNFDIVAAEAMMRTHFKWRKERKMDTILEEDWSDVLRDFPVTMDSYDKDGRPIGTLDIWDWPIRTGILQGKAKRVMRFLDYAMENLTMQVFEQQQKGLNVTQWKILGNAEEFNLIEHGCPLCLPFWVQFVQNFEKNYAGWLDELIVIEAPTTINVVLEAIRPFLSKQTGDALKIFGINKRRWLPYLDARISEDQRRPQYGGTKPLPNY